MTTSPSSLELLAALPVDDGCWGDTCADFQRRDATRVLAPTGPPFTFITRPRGGRKTTDGAGLVVALHLTVAPPGSRSYVVAADSAQANLVLDSVRSFVRRASILKPRVKIEARRVLFSGGGEVLSSCEVLPADEASSYGLRPYLVIADELSVWPDSANARGLWQAVVSAMPKVDGSRLIVLTSAGAPDHWSASVLAHARTSPQWQVSETPGPLPWLSADTLAEQRALLTPSMFARLHLNRWVAGEDRLTTPEQVRDCIGHAGPLEPRRGVRYVAGLDVGLVNDRTVLTVAHAEQRQEGVVVVVDHQETWQGTKAQPVNLTLVEAYVRETLRRYRGRLIFDPWQSVHLAQRLRANGVSVEPFTFSSASVGHLALTLYRLLRDRLLDLPDDDELTSELSSVVLRENQPGQFRIDTTAGHHDDRVISLALVCQKLAAQYAGVSSRLEIPQGVVPKPRQAALLSAHQDGPALAVVREGEPRPTDRLVAFHRARRHPSYRPPGWNL